MLDMPKEDSKVDVLSFMKIETDFKCKLKKKIL